MRKSLALACAAVLALAGTARADNTSGGAAFDQQIAQIRGVMLTQPQEARRLAQAAEAAAAKELAGAHRDLDLATARWLEAEALTRLDKPKDARVILDAVAPIVTATANGSKLHADVLKSRGRSEAAVGDVQAALGDFQQAFQIYQRLGDRRSQAICLQEIGSIYGDARDYAHVLQYYAQAEEIFATDPALNLTAHNNRGFALKDMGRATEAVAEFRKALVAASEMQSAYLQASILANIAWVEAGEGHRAVARAELAKAFRLANSDAEAKSETPFLLGVQARLAADEGDMAGAGVLLDRMFAGVDLKHTTPEFRDFHELAARVYEQIGDRKQALDQIKAFMRLDSDARSLAASTNSALMSARFDFANQSLKIANLKTDRAKAQARFTTIIAILLTVGGLIVTSLITFAFLNMRRSRNRIRAVNGELEQSNQALEKALHAKTEFLATTSHEIRTPLNGILGMTQVMLADDQVTGEMRERLRVVREAGDTMNALVSDILDVAKMETGELTIERAPLHLTALLDDAAQMWADKAATKGLSFELNKDDCPAHVFEDAARLRQILFNLLSNAVKFTDQGSVRVTVQVREDAGGERLEIAVADTGMGVAAEQQERIFEAFTQVDGGKSRQHAGTGLGLAICRQLANALDGDVTVQSALGEGSTFTLSLPLVRAEAGADAAPEQPSVTVLEDNPLARAMLKAGLEPKFGAVQFATTLEELNQAADRGCVDRALIDGACLARLRPDDPFAGLFELAGLADCAVVLWPALDEAASARLAALGFAHALSKPATLADVIAAVEAAPGRAAEGAQVQGKAA